MPRVNNLTISLVFSIGAFVSLCAGILGYMFYYPFISQRQPFFFCALPAGILSLGLMTLSFLFARFRIKNIVAFTPKKNKMGREVPKEFIVQNRKKLIKELENKNKELEIFITRLDEQHREGLLSDSAHNKLRTLYTSRLEIYSISLEKLRHHTISPEREGLRVEKRVGQATTDDITPDKGKKSILPQPKGK